MFFPTIHELYVFVGMEAVFFDEIKLLGGKIVLGVLYGTPSDVSRHEIVNVRYVTVVIPSYLDKIGSVNLISRFGKLDSVFCNVFVLTESINSKIFSVEEEIYGILMKWR